MIVYPIACKATMRVLLIVEKRIGAYKWLMIMIRYVVVVL